MKNTNITDSAINNINRKLIYKFTLDGKELPLSDVMNNPTITYDCGLDQYSVGNLYIGELSFSVKNTTFVNYKSEIVVTVDIQTDSGTISTKLGKFYVDTVVEQGVTKQIKAYDGMFLLNVGYFPSAKHTTTKAIVDDIASKHNLTILGFENRTANINNEQIDGKTVLEMLQLVAGVHGGSIFMNGDGAVKFVQATDTGKTYTKSQYSTPTLDTSISYNITKLRVTYGEKTTNEDGSVKDEGYFEVGEGLDSRTLAISNVLLKGQQTQAQNILNVIKNMNGYNRFDTTILLGDYRLEPMDVISYVKDDKTYKVPIIYMQIALTYSGLSIRTQSPTLAESKSEFSFKGTITQKIDNVYTEMMQVKDIVANSITVGDLEAINAKIENLEATDATITHLLAGNITADNIQAGSITSDRLVVEDNFIKDAMIDTVSASKLLAGQINTGSITIGSDDGKLLIADETIQISDGTNVRVQIGETANGDYALLIYDAQGQIMFDATGITENAINSAIIKDDMVASDANINGSKIDITSLITAINEDGSSTINVSKIYYDSKGQTLEVAFNEMTTRQDDLEETTDVLTTELNVQKGEIQTLVQNTTIEDNGETVTLKDAFSEFKQSQDEINLSVSTTISNIQDGDNLLKYTNFNYHGFPNDWWKTYTTYSSSKITHTLYNATDCLSNEEVGGIEIVNGTSTQAAVGIVQSPVNLIDGVQYTASAYFKTASSDTYVKISYMDDYYNSMHIIETTGAWQRVSFTFTYDANQLGTKTQNIKFSFYGTNFTGYICGMKLEKGAEATNWSSSFYDLEQRITSAELKITEDAIVSTVTNSTVVNSTINNTINNYEISEGKNLIKKSKDLSALTVGSVELSDDNGFYMLPLRYTYTGSSTSTSSINTNLPLHSNTNTKTVIGENVTLSFEYLVGYTHTHVTSVECYLYDTSGALCASFPVLKSSYSEEDLDSKGFKVMGEVIAEISGSIVNGQANYAKWRRVSCSAPFTYKSSISLEAEEYTYYIKLLMTTSVNDSFYALSDSFYFRKPKLEAGLKATPWSQAPEDLEEDVAEFEEEVAQEFVETYTKIEQNTESITLTASRTTANEEAISSLQVNADSINASVKEVTTTIDSITGELNTLTNKVEASMSSEDIKFLVSSEVANSSVGKVTTETGFTFDKDGLTISKSDSEMSTLVDEDGLTIYKNNDVMLDVNNQGVDAQNVNVKTYLIIGTNSRMENYSNNRTAIFFIGDTEV